MKNFDFFEISEIFRNFFFERKYFLFESKKNSRKSWDFFWDTFSMQKIVIFRFMSVSERFWHSVIGLGSRFYPMKKAPFFHTKPTESQIGTLSWVNLVNPLWSIRNHRIRNTLNSVEIEPEDCLRFEDSVQNKMCRLCMNSRVFLIMLRWYLLESCGPACAQIPAGEGKGHVCYRFAPCNQSPFVRFPPVS
jgi:hypothetical protein